MSSIRPQIAIIICTRNNPEKLHVTLSQVCRVLPPTISIVLVDQSDKGDVIRFSPNLRIKYIRTPHQKGLAKARNIAIQHTDADVLAWTDDDCVISKQYVERLSEIAKIAPTAKRKRIAGVCGRTLPYLQTRPTPNYHCPCTFSKSDSRPVKEVCTHWEHVGLGNNMVIFRYVFDEIGNFKEWLGAGAIGESGEDGEFMIRCLIARYQFLYDDKLLIYHNKWLDNAQARKQYWRYTCGGLALYGFYLFQGVKPCQREFNREVSDTLNQVYASLRNTIYNPFSFWRHFYAIASGLYYLSKGTLLAFLFARIVPIPNKEAVVRLYLHENSEQERL